MAQTWARVSFTDGCRDLLHLGPVSPTNTGRGAGAFRFKENDRLREMGLGSLRRISRSVTTEVHLEQLDQLYRKKIDQ
jgi:hypothetical protein